MADFLFDIGKVLLDFDFENSLVTLLPSSHPSPHDALAKLIEKKDDFEAGKISVGDYTQWAIETLETTASIEDFHNSWQNIFTPNEAMWSVARKLNSEGHRLILFSNTNAIHCPWIFDKYPDFSLFHGSILSFEVDAIKPQPLIYRHAIEKYSLVPEKTLYIDDLPANIRTGKDFGFRSHQYDLNEHPAFEAWLTAELGNLSPA